jgi:hypothetical protein
MNLVSQYSDGYEIAEKIQPDYPRLITEDEKKYGGWFELTTGTLWVVYESEDTVSVHICGKRMLNDDLLASVRYIAQQMGVNVVAREPLPKCLGIWLKRKGWEYKDRGYWLWER